MLMCYTSYIKINAHIGLSPYYGGVKMNARYWMKSDEFSMTYDDWMTFEDVQIEQTFVAKDIALLAEAKYPENISKEIDQTFDFMYDKALATHQKLAMMMFAKSKLKEVKADFESTQNMTCPALYGVSKTMILFYFESMIVFARNALDVAAYVYSDLLFGQRKDSYNDVIKKVKKSDDPLYQDFQSFLETAYDEDSSEILALRLLCGTERGRALRDTIVHQANVNMGYYEYKEGSEKEHLFLELKNYEPIDMDMFIDDFTDDVLRIFEETNNCCRRKLEAESSSH